MSDTQDNVLEMPGLERREPYDGEDDARDVRWGWRVIGTLVSLFGMALAGAPYWAFVLFLGGLILFLS